MKKIQILSATLIIASILGSTASHATITTLAYYKLGEADSPAAVNGGNGDNPTVDSNGGTGLAPVGTTPTYSFTDRTGNALNSSVAMNFSNGYYHLGNPVATSNHDFGFEMWVKPTAVAGFVFMNGDGYVSNGEYLYASAGQWHFARAGVSDNGFGTVALNQWVELAFVLDDSGGLHAYTNGFQVGSNVIGSDIAALAGTDFTLGKGFAGTSGQFNGQIDEVKVFSFTNFASFNPLTDLNLAAATPEPSTLVLLGVGGLLLWGRVRRNSRS